MKKLIVVSSMILSACNYHNINEITSASSFEKEEVLRVIPIEVTPVTIATPIPPPMPTEDFTCANPKYIPPPFKLVPEVVTNPTTLTVKIIKAIMQKADGRNDELPGGTYSPSLPVTFPRGDVDSNATFHYTLTYDVGGSLICSVNREVTVTIPRK